MTAQIHSEIDAKVDGKKLWDLHEIGVNFILMIKDVSLENALPYLIVENNKNLPITDDEVSRINTARSSFNAYLGLLPVSVAQTKDPAVSDAYWILKKKYLDDLENYLETTKLLYKQNKGKTMLLGHQLNILYNKFVETRKQIIEFNGIVASRMNALNVYSKAVNE